MESTNDTICRIAKDYLHFEIDYPHVNPFFVSLERLSYGVTTINPVLWYCFADMRRECEISCDEIVWLV